MVNKILADEATNVNNLAANFIVNSFITNLAVKLKRRIETGNEEEWETTKVRSFYIYQRILRRMYLLCSTNEPRVILRKF